MAQNRETGQEQTSPLLEATENRDFEAFKEPLAQGIDLNAPPPGGRGFTPLKLATHRRADEITIALIAGVSALAEELRKNRELFFWWD